MRTSKLFLLSVFVLLSISPAFALQYLHGQNLPNTADTFVDTGVIIEPVNDIILTGFYTQNNVDANFGNWFVKLASNNQTINSGPIDAFFANVSDVNSSLILESGVQYWLGVFNQGGAQMAWTNTLSLPVGNSDVEIVGSRQGATNYNNTIYFLAGLLPYNGIQYELAPVPPAPVDYNSSTCLNTDLTVDTYLSSNVSNQGSSPSDYCFTITDATLDCRGYSLLSDGLTPGYSIVLNDGGRVVNCISDPTNDPTTHTFSIAGNNTAIINNTIYASAGLSYSVAGTGNYFEVINNSFYGNHGIGALVFNVVSYGIVTGNLFELSHTNIAHSAIYNPYGLAGNITYSGNTFNITATSACADTAGEFRANDGTVNIDGNYYIGECGIANDYSSSCVDDNNDLVCDNPFTFELGTYDLTDNAPLVHVPTWTYPFNLTQCGDITSPGTYVLQNDISDTTGFDQTTVACFSIEASDVVFDCAGYTIDAEQLALQSGLRAFDITGGVRNNFELLNCNILNITNFAGEIISLDDLGGNITIKNSDFKFIDGETAIVANTNEMIDNLIFRNLTFNEDDADGICFQIAVSSANYIELSDVSCASEVDLGGGVYSVLNVTNYIQSRSAINLNLDADFYGGATITDMYWNNVTAYQLASFDIGQVTNAYFDNVIFNYTGVNGNTGLNYYVFGDGTGEIIVNESYFNFGFNPYNFATLESYFSNYEILNASDLDFVYGALGLDTIANALFMNTTVALDYYFDNVQSSNGSIMSMMSSTIDPLSSGNTGWWPLNLTGQNIQDEGTDLQYLGFFDPNGGGTEGDGTPNPAYEYFAEDIGGGGPEVAPVASFTANQTAGYAPLTVSFTDTSTNTPTSWAWDFDRDGIVDNTTQNPVYTFTVPGIYEVNLTVTNSNSSSSNINLVFVESFGKTFTATGTQPRFVRGIVVIPSRNITITEFIKTGDTQCLIACGSPGFGENYLNWAIYDNATMTVLGNGIWGAGGIQNVSISNIQLVAGQAYVFAAVARLQSLIGYGFESGQTYPQTYGALDVQSGFVSTVAGNYVSPVGAITYDSTWYVFDQINYIDTPQLINVSAVPPVLPVANFTATPLTGYAPLKVNFTDLSTATTSWAWDFENDGIVDSTQQNPTKYFLPGTYDVNLTVTNENGTNTLVQVAYVTAYDSPFSRNVLFWSDLVEGNGTPTDALGRVTDIALVNATWNSSAPANLPYSITIGASAPEAKEGLIFNSTELNTLWGDSDMVAVCAWINTSSGSGTQGIADIRYQDTFPFATASFTKDSSSEMVMYTRRASSYNSSLYAGDQNKTTTNTYNGFTFGSSWRHLCWVVRDAESATSFGPGSSGNMPASIEMWTDGVDGKSANGSTDGRYVGTALNMDDTVATMIFGTTSRLTTVDSTELAKSIAQPVVLKFSSKQHDLHQIIPCLYNNGSGRQYSDFIDSCVDTRVSRPRIQEVVGGLLANYTQLWNSTDSTTFRWFVNDVEEGGQTNNSFSNTLYNSSDKVTVEITPNGVGTPINISYPFSIELGYQTNGSIVNGRQSFKANYQFPDPEKTEVGYFFNGYISSLTAATLHDVAFMRYDYERRPSNTAFLDTTVFPAGENRFHALAYNTETQQVVDQTVYVIVNNTGNATSQFGVGSLTNHPDNYAYPANFKVNAFAQYDGYGPGGDYYNLSANFFINHGTSGHLLTNLNQYMGFENNYADARAGVSATVGSGVTQLDSGCVFGKCYEFNGNDTSQILRTVSTTVPATISSGGAVTSAMYSLWIYPTNTTGNRAIFHNAASFLTGWSFVQNESVLQWRLTTLDPWAIANTSVIPNQWNHVLLWAGTTGQGKAIYLNGELVNTTTAVSIGSSSGAVLGASTSAGNRFIGRMDEFAVWNNFEALATSANSTNCYGYGPSLNCTMNASYVAQYLYNGGAGRFAYNGFESVITNESRLGYLAIWNVTYTPNQTPSTAGPRWSGSSTTWSKDINGEWVYLGSNSASNTIVSSFFNSALEGTPSAYTLPTTGQVGFPTWSSRLNYKFWNTSVYGPIPTSFENATNLTIRVVPCETVSNGTIYCADPDVVSQDYPVVFTVEVEEATEVDAAFCSAIVYPNELDQPAPSIIPFNFTVTSVPMFFNESYTATIRRSGDSARNATCSYITVDADTRTYLCNVSMNYYTRPGLYTINVNFTSNGITANYTNSGACSYGQLVAYQRTGGTLTFPGASPGVSNVQAPENITIRNTGNVPLNLSINAKNLVGRSIPANGLGVANFRMGSLFNESVALSNNTDVLIGEIEIGPASYKVLNTWLSIPQNQYPQDYYSAQAWAAVGE